MNRRFLLRNVLPVVCVCGCLIYLCTHAWFNYRNNIDHVFEVHSRKSLQTLMGVRHSIGAENSTSASPEITLKADLSNGDDEISLDITSNKIVISPAATLPVFLPIGERPTLLYDSSVYIDCTTIPAALKDSDNVLVVAPNCLLTWKRFDLAAKYLYAYFLLRRGINNSTESSFSVDIYLRSIEVFNHFCEKSRVEGECWKSTPKAFIDHYDSVIHSMANSGFNVDRAVPTDRQGVIVDGAHRTAAALACGAPVSIRLRDNIDTDLRWMWDYEWFLGRGLDLVYADAMALTFVLNRPETIIVSVFPGAIKHEEALLSVLRQYGGIIYRKDIYLRLNGAKFFLLHAYPREIREGFLSNKVVRCFSSKRDHIDEPTRVFVLQLDQKEYDGLRDDISAIFDGMNNIVHVTESHSDTVLLAHLVLNDNSIHMANHIDFSNRHVTAAELLLPLREWLSRLTARYGVEAGDDIIIADAHFVASIYGFEEHGNTPIALQRFSAMRGVDRSVAKLPSGFTLTVAESDDVILNPSFHMYFLGVKMIALHVAQQHLK